MDQRDVEWRPSDGIGISTVLVDIRWHGWSRKRSNAFEENIFTSNMNKRSYSSKMFEKNVLRETFATKLNPSVFWLVTPNYARIWRKKKFDKDIPHRKILWATNRWWWMNLASEGAISGRWALVTGQQCSGGLCMVCYTKYKIQIYNTNTGGGLCIAFYT